MLWLCRDVVMQSHFVCVLYTVEINGNNGNNGITEITEITVFFRIR